MSMMTDVLVLIPSISVQRVREAEDTLVALSRRGVRVCICQNAASLSKVSFSPELGILDFGVNSGFAATVNRAANYFADWDVVVLLNDDLAYNPDLADDLTHTLSLFDWKSRSLLFLSEERRRRIPEALGVFTDLSLLSGVIGRVVHPNSVFLGGGKAANDRYYKSFSAVAISRALWDALGGLDEAYPFTYEDADFARRAQMLPDSLIIDSPLHFGMEHSYSSSKHIYDVLPCVAVSSLRYLESLGVSKVNGILVVCASLLLRVSLTPFARAPWRPHVRAVFHALRLILLGKTPSLTPYASL